MDDEFIQSIRNHVRDSLLYLLASDRGTASATQPGLILTEQAENDRADFINEYRDAGCTCFIFPPCGFCLHEGNPINQEETPECWEFAFK